MSYWENLKDKYPHYDIYKLRCGPPSMKTLNRWISEGIAKATDGCQVEPDGTCEHGHHSWLLSLGYI